tara:strand:+ start:51609 stop:52730 length:1122 start_codon:yes stop_codon:yes gene_type:complete
MPIPFNKPYKAGNELDYLKQVLDSDHMSGNYGFTKKCHEFLKKQSSAEEVFLTQSATAGLEMALMLADIGPGDEVILPSFTFSSCATAIVRQGGVPVFVDVDFDSRNVTASYLEKGITDKTKLLLPVHYAGNPCEMDDILALAKQHNLIVLEDAAQGLGSAYKGKALGSLGHLGVYSFHETKNITCGEGGALLVNASEFKDRAEILWEKGTNRRQFFRGEVDKYSWVDQGSSFLPSELTAAVLWAQLQKLEEVTLHRRKIWEHYYQRFEALEERGVLTRPKINEQGNHNGHIFSVTFNEGKVRDRVLDDFRSKEMGATFHYIPLHSSPAGKKYGRVAGDLTNVNQVSERLIRLPIWYGFEAVDQVVGTVEESI